MTVLSIIDTESIGADEMKKLLRVGDGINSIDIETPVFENDGTKIQLKQTVRVMFDRSILDKIQNAALEVQGSGFITHKTKISMPDVDGSSDTFNYNNYASDAFSYYNLRFEDYENYTTAAEERTLPNFLIGALYQRSFEQEQENFYTMFGAISDLSSTVMLAPSTPINNYEFDGQYLGLEDYDAALRTDYFRIYYENKETVVLSYDNANNHVYVDYDYNLSDSSQIGNCPFFNRIRLPSFIYTPGKNSTIPDDKLQSPITNAILESSITDFFLKSFRKSNSTFRNFEVNGTTTGIKVYDLFDELESFDMSTNLIESDEMFLKESTTLHLNRTQNPFLFYFYKLLAIGKFRSLMRANLLDYDKISFGDDHQKEHIGFKVIKRRQGRSTPIQTFYFIKRIELKDFIDTQIRFNTEYIYDVVAMYAIHGSNYSYENINILTETQQPVMVFEFVNRPSLKIAEIPVASHALRVVEPPPIAPEVQFFNEKTTKNKIKIRLEHQDGNIVNEYNRKPMMPFSGNQDYIERLKQYFNSDDILVQSGKTSSGVYEIYRIDNPPNTYADFEGNLIATVQSNVVYNNGDRSKNVMFVDYIRHQKEYYYMFRTLSHQGNPSNTSSVYKIEMYEDADETFLLINTYSFPEPDYYDNNMSMRKYLQIIPNFEHTIINESDLDPNLTAEDAVENINLGLLPTDEGLWSYSNKDKYIKLRLESKNSGRKLDLNLLFKIIKPN